MVTQFVQLLNRAGIPFEHVSANSFSDYETALDNFDPFILVHIGHGVSSWADETTYLEFGTERRRLSELTTGGKIAPIVLFASCNSFASSTHEAPAAIYLSLGSRAVLGTFMEVDADRTLTLLGVVLEELWRNLNEQTTRRVTWGQVVFWAMQQNRYYDLLRTMAEKGAKVSAFDTSEIILALKQDWFAWCQSERGMDPAARYSQMPERLRQILCRRYPEKTAEIEKLLMRSADLPHGLLFNHLGSPESIVLQVVSTPSPQIVTAASPISTTKQSESDGWPTSRSPPERRPMSRV